ncbi:MAG: tetratricopeptide repeat protein [Cyclobacteriaceae bacterium]
MWKSKFIQVLLASLFSIPLFAQVNPDLQLANEYYNQGDYEKAKALYSDLSKKPRNIPQIHNFYLSTLINLEHFAEAEKYLIHQIKQFEDNLQYQLDLGILYGKQEKKELADKQFNTVIKSIAGDNYKVIYAAQYLINKQQINYALLTYQQGRLAGDDELAFAMEMASIYRRLNEKDLMIQEYLNFARIHPNNLNYVKNNLQHVLTQEEDLINLEQVLYQKVQEFPNESMYTNLLIWVNLQQHNFYGAFIQARAIDKRRKTQGNRVLEIGEIALENDDYDNAVKIFSYLVKEYPVGPNYELSKRYLIKSREEMVKNTYPVNPDEIATLIEDYQNMIDEIGINEQALEAMRSQALLHAFFLDQLDSAINKLEIIITTPGVGPGLQSQAKLDLGDILLLDDQPWESTLLYSQVEKTQKEQALGYEAKLRNAKLSYYTGNFELAQGHLDILKLATSREIANNALALSLLIQDNTVFDSTDVAMKAYASVELMLFQNQDQQSLDALDAMLVTYQNHSLTDEILWLQSKIYLERGDFSKALELLSKIVNQYRYDILSDDAYFQMGTIYQDQLKQNDKAMEIFQDFLIQFPGSIYSSEARKRFRTLRGDFSEAEEKLLE